MSGWLLIWRDMIIKVLKMKEAVLYYDARMDFVDFIIGKAVE